MSKQTLQTEHPLQDFRVFLQIVWESLNLPKPTAIQYDIAKNLQDPNKKSLVIEAFRGVGKSWITSAFCCHQLLLNPQLNILVTSASKSRSDDFSTFVKRLFKEIPLLQHLYPRTDQRQSNVAFDVAPARPSHSPSVKSVGISGQLTGTRADILIADDVEVPNNSYSQTMREKIEKSVQEFGAILKPGGRIIYLGTPQTSDSLYTTLPDKGFEVVRYPALYPSKEYLNRYDDVAPMLREALLKEESLEGTSTDPEHFSNEDFARSRMSYANSGFALQFMLDTEPSDADRSPLKLKDFITLSLSSEEAPDKLIHSNNPSDQQRHLHCTGLKGDAFFAPQFTSQHYMPYTASLLTIDPAGRGKDETAWCVTKLLNSKIFLIDIGGYSSGGYSEENLTFLANKAKQHQVNSVLIEDNFGDGMFTELLKPYMKKIFPCSFEEGVRQTLQKERRIIDSVEPLLNQHRIVLNSSIPTLEENLDYSKQFLYQLTHVTPQRQSLKQDDRLDCFSMACRFWTEQLAQSQEDHLETQKQRLLQKELESFNSHISSNLFPPPTQNFLQPLQHLRQ